jgi:phosphocarrier protein
LVEVKGTFEIVNKLGMHARAAAVFVQRAKEFKSEITVRKQEIEVSGKSIMGVLQLAALQGESIEIVAEGEDGHEALKALGDLVAERFGEEE